VQKTFDVTQKNTDRLISLILLFFCVFLYREIQQYSPYGRVFPNAIILILAVFSVVYFFRSWITLFTSKVGPQEELYRMVEDYPSFLIAFPLTMIYVFYLLTFLGFFTSSFVFAAAVILSIKIVRNEYNWKVLLIYFIFSGLFSYVVYYVFRYMLRIRLPSGIFF